MASASLPPAVAVGSSLKRIISYFATSSPVKSPNATNGTPQEDTLNTLMRNPVLYDPILAPRNPIILCHGLYGFDVRGPGFLRLHYWSDLLDILADKVGAKVIVTAVPGTGAIKERAHVLHQALERNESIRNQDVNFLGHSMGGLDARYLISNIQPTSYHPRSLTSVATPHKGSPFMSWCRANIGIGTTLDSSAEIAAKLAHELKWSPLSSIEDPVPFSLNSPILARQMEAVKSATSAAKEAQKVSEEVKKKLSLSGYLSNYLLDLLDSPAYANLTPSFMRDVFNPSTPDKPGVKYFSIAAHTLKIPIWHPLWLPKLVLDGTEATKSPLTVSGNDGLVTVESAKWGEFLGVAENCDHWEIRGSSRLVGMKESAEFIKSVQREKDGDSKDGWSWQDLYKLVGYKRENSSETVPDTKSKESGSALGIMASWIVDNLPPLPVLSSKAAPKEKATLTSAPSKNSIQGRNKLLYGLGGGSPESADPRAPFSTSSHSHQPKGSQNQEPSSPKFNLERMVLAICRKLHQEGL